MKNVFVCKRNIINKFRFGVMLFKSIFLEEDDFGDPIISLTWHTNSQCLTVIFRALIVTPTEYLIILITVNLIMDCSSAKTLGNAPQIVVLPSDNVTLFVLVFIKLCKASQKGKTCMNHRFRKQW